MRFLKLTNESGERVLINMGRIHYVCAAVFYDGETGGYKDGAALSDETNRYTVRETPEEIEAMLERQDQSSNA